VICPWHTKIKSNLRIPRATSRLATTPSHGVSMTSDRSPIPVDVSSGNEDTEETQPPTDVILMSTVPNTQRGKAPPVEPFTGEGVDTLFEEWLPTFEWMATWNNWS